MWTATHVLLRQQKTYTPENAIDARPLATISEIVQYRRNPSASTAKQRDMMKQTVTIKILEMKAKNQPSTTDSSKSD